MALKVVELLVDEALTGETRVEEIALVLQPAIETEFVYFKEQSFQESYSDYPEAVKNNAQKVLRYVEENGWGSCGTAVGKQRANQLAKGEAISVDTIQRMFSYLSRHKQDLVSSKSYDDGCGLLMWDSWGGDEALGWAERKLRQIEEEMGYDVGSLAPYIQTTGTTLMAEVGERGGIRESKKAPKSDTPNPNPQGEGSARGDASGKRGAKVTAEQEKTLQKKVDDFNERESNTKHGKATLGALKSVFQRGLGAYNVSHSPKVQSAEQWAYARVNAFLYLLKNGRPENPKYKGDNDLLPNEHPKSKEKFYCDYEMSEVEMDIFGYKTKYFFICPGARSTFEQIISIKPTEDSIGMIRSAAVVADKVFEIESNVLKNETATQSDLDAAKVLVEDFKDIIGEIEKIQGKKYDVSYMDGHIQTISSYVGKEQLTEIDGCGCGCWDDGTYPYPQDKLYFGDTMINGMPVYDTLEEAEAAAENYGCSGAHPHIIDGKEVYMPCEVHPEEDEEEEEMCGCGMDDYTPEEFEAAKLLQFLAHNHPEKFEAVVAGMNGSTEREIYARDHKRPTTYFLYKRVLDGNPDRDFCMSIEGRYFRRLEIDMLRDTNKDFGHKKQPYSKWLYKGGPECVHIWQRFIFQGKDKVDRGPAEGLAGTPPKAMPNNGYYSAETKRKSQQAYIISQQNMTRQSNSVIIVDVDDTLLRGGAPIQKTKDYINKKWETHKIVVVSGRQDSRLSETRRQLERAGIKFDEIHLSDFPAGPNASRAFKKNKAKLLLEKKYRIVEAIDNDDTTRRDYQKLGIKTISPVSLSQQTKLEFKVDGERRMIYSPAMKPGILIPRIDEATKERYFVTFRPETIETMAQRYMIEKRSGGGHTNLEHTDQKFQDVYLVESWIVDGDQDKAYSLGYTKQQVPKGTWMVGFRVDSNEVWEMVKEGDIKGISIEGNFEYKFSSHNTDEYLLKEIINIINQIQ